MTDQWPVGPYSVWDPVKWKRIPAGSEFEAKQIADRLSEDYGVEVLIYKYVADDDAYLPVGGPRE